EPLIDEAGVVRLLLAQTRAVVHRAGRDVGGVPEDHVVEAVEHGQRRTLFALPVRDARVDTTTHDTAAETVALGRLRSANVVLVVHDPHGAEIRRNEARRVVHVARARHGLPAAVRAV